MKQFLWLVVLATAFGLGNAVLAQDSGRSDKPASDKVDAPKTFIEQLRTHCHKHASAFVFAQKQDGAKPFLLEPKPVLTWTSTGDVAPCDAQEDATKDDAAIKKAVTEHWLGVADKLAKDYVFTPVSAVNAPFTLHDKAIFRHTQTVRGDDIGSVYLWKEASGRPAVIGVIFAWTQGRNRYVMHEFHSLHKQGIAMDLPGKKSWTTDQPGLKWLPFPKADPPDASLLKRKLQAKALSRRVSANATDPAKSRWELRLVPTAIYEYGIPDEGVDYGGVFSLCQGTDTELLVIVEARKTADKSEWHYAIAPFTDYQLAVSIDDQKLWESPQGSVSENGKPHYWDFLELQPKPDFEP